MVSFVVAHDFFLPFRGGRIQSVDFAVLRRAVFAVFLTALLTAVFFVFLVIVFPVFLTFFAIWSSGRDGDFGSVRSVT
ncbi:MULTISPECIES: hypothetical protein [unclassified Bradyrhizobium]|uniref:hypothetical protein n=1 Tax=unclassified Bradyrhizobium TaxID=2631580 RepID=UPI0029160EEB|nr:MULTISPECIES: hypothetical protein [unclassified Bradyrhizobium]